VHATVQPGELWQSRAVWAKYGRNCCGQGSARSGLCYGPTHEEVITDIRGGELRSYKQLPVNFIRSSSNFAMKLFRGSV